MIKHIGLTRRDFLIRSALAGTGITLGLLPKPVIRQSVLGANDTVRVAVIGLGRYGRQHVAQYSLVPKVEICGLCDTDESALRKEVQEIADAGFRRPAAFADYRSILDSKDIDAVSIATPRGLHAQMAISACEAGKHVYVEKPCATNIREGRKLAEAADKYGRIAQQRAESRFVASPELMSLVQSRSIGTTHSVKGYSRSHGLSLKGIESYQENPDQHSSNMLMLLEQSLDQLDFARGVLEVGLPVHVSAVKMIDTFTDQVSAIAFRLIFDAGEGSHRTLEFELTSATHRQPFVFANDGPIDSVASGSWFTPNPHYERNAEGSCTFITSGGQFSVRSNPSTDSGPSSEFNNWFNFIDCIRSNNPETLHSPIKEARISCSLIQLTELALRHQRSFSFDPASERAPHDEEINTCVM